MKSVALVGFSKRSNQRAHSLPDGMELWTLNHGHLHGFPKVDRLYDMHPWELINDPNFYYRDYQQGHKEFLQAPHDFPVYMVQRYEQIPASREYPLKDALALAGEHLNFTSSFCYMIAAAILEGYGLIWVLGFDMGWGTEYAYQREDALKWISFARGIGIAVWVAPESALYPRKRYLYGYERIPMVTREAIETKIRAYEEARSKAQEKLQQWTGILAERERAHASRAQKEEAAQQAAGWDRTVAMNEGAIQTLKELLVNCDLVEYEPVNLEVSIEEDRR